MQAVSAEIQPVRESQPAHESTRWQWWPTCLTQEHDASCLQPQLLRIQQEVFNDAAASRHIVVNFFNV